MHFVAASGNEELVLDVRVHKRNRIARTLIKAALGRTIAYRRALIDHAASPSPTNRVLINFPCHAIPGIASDVTFAPFAETLNADNIGETYKNIYLKKYVYSLVETYLTV